MWIKICGLNDTQNAREVAQLGPDAIGLNFYGRSPRSVSIEIAAKIVSDLPENVEPVGLFVNHSVDEILRTCRECAIRTVQLHGDEPPEQLAELASANPDLRFIRAYRLGEQGFAALTVQLERCKELGVGLDACLIDAKVDGMYGGSGKQAPRTVIRSEYRYDEWPPIVLAGGLNAVNISQAIAEVRPWGIDVSSGVESRPGVKDIEQVSSFVRSARGRLEQKPFTE